MIPLQRIDGYVEGVNVDFLVIGRGKKNEEVFNLENPGKNVVPYKQGHFLFWLVAQSLLNKSSRVCRHQTSEDPGSMSHQWRW